VQSTHRVDGAPSLPLLSDVVGCKREVVEQVKKTTFDPKTKQKE
jgi:hypothetical protein